MWCFYSTAPKNEITCIALLLSVLIIILNISNNAYVECTGTYKSMVIGGMSSDLNNVAISSIYINPGNIYLDATAGVLYTTETAKIRKITLSSGIISTVVGSGTPGTTYTTDPTTTQTHTPKSLTRWKTHLIWIDANMRIRKLDSSTNQVSVIFSAGYGNSDNTVTNPLLVQSGSSLSITVDPSDNIYFADYSNWLIRKIDGNTNVASVYKSGLLGYTNQIKYCNGGLYAYVNDNVNFYIQKLTESGGTVYANTAVGGGSSKSTGISGTSYLMDGTNFVTKMDCYNNELYWNAYDYSIRKLTTGGIVQQVLGNGYRGESADGTVTSSSIIGYIEYFTINPTNGDLYFAENNYNIRKLVGTTLSSFLHYRNVLNERNAKTLQLVPSAIALYSDGFYLADTNSIKFYNLTSSTIKHYAGYFYLPYNNKAPSGSDNIGGSYVTARYSNILSMTCTPTGDIYMIDNYSPGFFLKLLSKSTGLVTIVAGAASGSDCVNGNTPTACTITNAKNLQYYNGEIYFASDNYIYKISSSTGKIVVVLGGGASTSDGASSSANIATLFSFTIRPSDGKIYYFQQIGSTFYLKVFTASTVATRFTTSSVTIKDFYVNDNGNVYYTESGALKLFTPATANANTGTITSYAGNSAGTYNDGETLANTKFNTLVGLTFASDNNLMLIAESDELRKIYMTCDANYGGSYCNLPYCYSKRSDDISVCNSHGTCTAINTCTCATGYSNSNCSSWTCNGYSNSVTTGCSNQGTCTAYNSCSCSSNYYGANCSVTTCNGVYSNSSQVCSGHGACSTFNTCSCSLNYYGFNCEIFDCYYVAKTNSSVCSGHGTCMDYNSCSCSSNYYGSNCSITTCYGTLQNYSSVCNSHGSCVGLDSCQCNSNYGGSQCQYPYCFGILSNETSVCSEHGSCVDYNSCTCSSNYYGSNCSITTCYGTLQNNSSVCNSHGSCVGLDSCQCNSNFGGSQCQYPNCFGIFGHGDCPSLNNCNCTAGYFGADCSLNTAVIVQTYECFGISSLEDTVVCSGKGECIGNDLCKCSNGFFGSKCNVTSCNGKRQDNPTVCSGKGKCFEDGHCQCSYGYGGQDCQVKTCFGKTSLDPNVCSGRGVCVDIDTCQCFSSNGISVKITGDECENLLCKGVYNGVEDFYSSNDFRVCSKHGNCSTGGCSCAAGYYGDKCEMFNCNSIAKNNSHVCSGHGDCVGINTCSCYSDSTNGFYSGSDCNTCHPAYTGANCNVKTCTGSTCMNGGSCGTDNSCDCIGNFTGLICETCKSNSYGSQCNVYCNSQSTCNGHGQCGSDGQCICFSDTKNGYWNGSSCSSCQNGYFGSDCFAHFESFNSTYVNEIYSQVTDFFDGVIFKLFAPPSYLPNTVPCSKLIYIDDQPLFGTEPKCFWIDKENGDFKIQFDYDFTLNSSSVIGNHFRVNRNLFTTLTRRLNKLGAFSTRTIVDDTIIYLMPPNTVKSPVADVKSSKRIYSETEDMIFSGSDSFSGDRKELDYTWSIEGNSINSTVENFIKSNKQATIKIDKGLLKLGIYKLTLVVRSTVTSEVSLINIFTLQILEYQVPSVSIYGSKKIRQKSTEKPVHIKKTTTIPDYLKNETMNIEWQQIEGPNVDFKKDIYNNLIIESFTKGAFKYVFKISITPEKNSSLSSSDYVIINTEQPELSLYLSLKSVTNYSSTIQVNYQDPENNTDETELWQWSCINSETDGYCGDGVVDKMSFHSKNHSTLFIVDKSDFSLSTLQKPTFTLSIRKGERKASCSITLNIVHLPPILNIIDISPDFKSVVNSDEKFSIEVSHSKQDLSDSSLSIKTEWKIDTSIVSESETTRIESTDSFSTTTTMLSTSSYVQVVSKNTQSAIIIDAREFDEGTEKTIALKVSYVQTNESNIVNGIPEEIEIASTESSTTITKATQPQKCPCSITPSNGVSMETEFKVSCVNCQNEQNTIEITQGYVDSETGIKIQVPISEEDTVKIPAVVSSSSNTPQAAPVKWFVELTDTESGESRTMYTNITVTTVVVNTTEEIWQQVSNQTTEIISAIIQDGNPIESISQTVNTIVSTSQLLQSLPQVQHQDSETITKIQTQLLSTLASAVETTRVETSIESTSSMVVYAVYSVIKSDEIIVPVVTDKSISILNEVVDQAVKSNLQISTETSQTVMSIVENLQSSVENITSTLEQLNIYDQLVNVTENLAYSIVKEQTVSADPIVLQTSSLSIQVDKIYFTDLSDSVISSITTEMESVNKTILVNISLPSFITMETEYVEITYSMVVEEYSSTILQQILTNITNTTTLQIASPVITSFSIMETSESSVANQLMSSQNVSIEMLVDSGDFIEFSSSYSCMGVNTGNMSLESHNCTAEYDESTSSVKCNCIFNQLQISNLVVVRNVTTIIEEVVEMEEYTCFGISSLEDTVVCSGKGECIGNDLCKCSNGFFGSKCNVTSCNGKRQDNPTVCSGKGKCFEDGHCQCSYGYGGKDCQVKTCFGKTSLDPNVCSGRGVCVDVDKCQCYVFNNTNVKITGSTCENLLCRGVYNGVEDYFATTDYRACSNHGKCVINATTLEGKCQCNSGYYGTYCGAFNCYGLANNDTNVCSGHGSCTGINSCSCYSNSTKGFYSGSTCSSCHPAYSGANCLTRYCNNSTCLHGGTCVNNICNCVGNFTGLLCESCKTYQYGSNCDIYCNPKTFCNSHGSCTSAGKCSCYVDTSNGYWNGTSCAYCRNNYYGTKCLTYVGSYNSTLVDNIYAQVSDYYDAITFKLIAPSTYTANTVTCSKLIHPDDFSLFGSEPKCFWTDKANGIFTIQFDFDNDFDLSSGSNSFRLNSYIFSTTTTILNEYYISVFFILSKTVIPPVAKVKSTKKVYSTTEDLAFSGTNSYSGDKKELDYTWDIQGNNIPAIVKNKVQANKLPSIKIDKGYLLPGVYKVLLIVRSKVTNEVSSKESFSFQIQGYAVPSVSVSGNKETTYKSTEKLVLVKKTTTIPDYISGSSVSIEWEQLEGPSLSFKKDAYNNLIIDSFIKGKWKFVFKITITAAQNSSLSSSDYVIINTEQPELSLYLSLKSVTNYSSTIQVNYQDPENNTDETELWQWSCINSETDGYCGDGITDKLALYSKNRAAVVNANYTDFSILTLTKPKLTLTITKGERKASCSITLNIVHPPPILSIIGISPVATKVVNSNDKISIEVQKSSQDLTDTTISVKTEWKVDETGISQSETSTLQSTTTSQITTTTTVTSASSSIQVVNKNEQSAIIINAAGLEELVDHSIQLKVSYIQKNESNLIDGSPEVIEIASTESSTNFAKATQPQKCPCFVSPSNGVSMQTDFTLTCQNCQNEQNSIEITQGYIDKETNTKIPVPLNEDNVMRIPALVSTDSQLTTQRNETMTLFIELTDTKTGESRMMYTNVTVATVEATSMTDVIQQVRNQTSEIISNFNRDGDSSQGISQTVNTIVSINQMLQTLPEAAKRSTLVTNIQTNLLNTLETVTETISETITATTTSLVVYAAQSIVKNEVNLDPVVIDKSISILDNTIEQATKSQVEITTETTKTFLTVIETLYTNIENITNTNTQFNSLEKVSSLTKNLATSIVIEQPVSADPVILQTSTLTVVVDKVYLTDFSNSTISTSGNDVSVNISIPAIESMSKDNHFTSMTYSVTIEENTAMLVDSTISSSVTTIVQNIKTSLTTTTTVEVVSSVSTSFSIVENVTTVTSQILDELSSKNVTVEMSVEELPLLPPQTNITYTYSCVGVESDMSLNGKQCTASYDEQTSTVKCNCQFTELAIDNLLVIRNITTVQEITTTLSFDCFGISSLETKVVCSGNGECIGNDLCKCSNGFFGYKCNITSCNGKRQDDPTVCSGKGKCSSDGKCTCQFGYGGQACQDKTCYGISSTDAKVCSGRGTCLDIDKCSCLSISGVKITGDSCENLLCRGIYNGVEDYYSSTDFRVCSNHGKCFINSTSGVAGCICNSGYYGEKCDQFDCNSISKSSSNVCSGHGQCVDVNTCSCVNDDVNGHYYGSDCNTCHPAYTGPTCTERSCTVSTCLNGGSCGSNNTCVCTGNFDGFICEKCKTNYYGPNCDIYCNGQTTCNGHGNCDITGKCSCYQDRDNGYWNGISCNDCMNGYFGSDCATYFGSFNSTYINEIYAQINELFDGVTLKLFAPPSYTANTVPCSKLIHADDLQLLGTEPKCFWTDKANGNFKIQFDYDFSLTASSNIRVNKYAFSKITTTIIEIYIRIYFIISQTVKPPVAQVTSSKKLFSYYEDIIFSGSNSYSGDKKELEYIWDIQGDSISSTVLNNIRSNKLSTITIQKGSLIKGVYTLILKVKSQISAQYSSIETIAFQVQDVEMASVLISGEKQNTFKSTDKLVSIKKVTYLPTYLKDQAINVDWEQIEGPSIRYHKDSYQNLIIEKFASGKVKYVFKVTIIVANQTSTISDFAIINTYQPDLSLSLSLKETSSMRNVIQVSSEDPENNVDEKEVWKWTCINSETNGYCGDGILDKMSLYSKNHSSIVIFNQEDFSTLTLTKPKLTLTITKGERQTSSSITLNIVHSPPMVTYIAVEPTSNSIINSNGRISIEVQHSNQDLTDSSVSVKSQWKIDNGVVSESFTSKSYASNSLTTITTISPTSENIQVVNKNEQSAIIVNSKQLEEGVAHAIQFKASYVQKSESSEIEIASTESSNSFTKAAQPQKCPCTVSPSEGISMQTDFTLTCQNCQNQQNTIQIKQGYIDVDTGIMIYIPLTQEKTMKLPSSSSSTSNSTTVKIFVELTDTQTGEFRIMYYHVTVMRVVVTSITQIVQQVTTQTNTIMSSFVKDGDSSQSISQTINTIVSTNQMLQTLPESEKSATTITNIQTTLLDILANATETTSEETISESTSSMIVYAIHTMLKNEQNIGQVVIEKSVNALENIVEQNFRTNVGVPPQTTQTFMSVVENLVYASENITNLKDQFARDEEISALTEKLALTIVKGEPVSASAVVLNSGVSIVKADKEYVKYLSQSVIGSPSSTDGKYQANIVNITMPDILVSDSNPFGSATYSVVVKENIPIIVQKLINQQDENSTIVVVSPVSTSFSIQSNTTAVGLRQNVTFHIRVSKDDYGIFDISSYSCVRVQSDLGNDYSSCSISGYNNATSTTDCNCVFSDLFISNVIVVKNTSLRTFQAANTTYLTTQDIIIISTVIGGTCFISITCFFIALVAGVIYRRGSCVCCCCGRRRKTRPQEEKDNSSDDVEMTVRAQMISLPSKNSYQESANTTSTQSQGSISVRMLV
ncbi:predicted protein [Naegleria gruberi]|uniref:Predicted protein n=1 Tax=Naegleria gruberi TaxID=5762 RepID=D2VNL7_NAEGR|nr:uncharacterized protein NAEGRDRAFT_70543 [Naegleria gruberi]EFC41524.1 predicted protein [Naegleria gruberi]|eukprot:XP_002674268.1 predicted protein [Naegleria gruberi strain NEG-M]